MTYYIHVLQIFHVLSTEFFKLVKYNKFQMYDFGSNELNRKHYNQVCSGKIFCFLFLHF